LVVALPATAEQWFFSADYIVENLGSSSLSELMIGLMVRREVCAEINKYLGLSIDLSTPIGVPISFTKFTGIYRDDVAYTYATGVLAEGCYRADVTEGTQTGEYIYGKALVIR